MIGSVEWPTLEDIMRAEGEVVLPELTEKMAYGIGCQAVDAGLQHGLPIAIGLWRGERQLFHCALPGSTRDNGRRGADLRGHARSPGQRRVPSLFPNAWRLNGRA